MATPPQLSKPPTKLTLEQERLRIVLYGEPGAGKTTLASTFPRPMFINTDDGLVSLAIEGIDVMHFEPEGYRDMEGLYWWLKERIDTFDTVVLDSVTTAQRLFLDEIHDLSLAAATRDKKPVMQWVPEQGEYLAQQRQMARMLTDLRRLDKHLIVTAGVKNREGRRSPDTAPGLFSILNHWASIMAELQVITHDAKGEELPKPRRILYTGYGARDTKSRFRSLLPYVPDPTYKTIWGRVIKQYQEATTKQNEQAREETVA